MTNAFGDHVIDIDELIATLATQGAEAQEAGDLDRAQGLREAIVAIVARVVR